MILSRIKKRQLYLKTLYDKSDGRDGVDYEMWSVGNELGFTHYETNRIVEFLRDEGFVLTSAGGNPVKVWLTHEGVKEVERLESQA